MIIIAPYAQKLRNGKVNPKNYPYWKELIGLMDEPIIQVGISGEEQLVDDFRVDLSLHELAIIVAECKTWVSVDSFFQHFCWDIGKPGVVLWGQSNPLIFGHDENINLLKGMDYLRPNQFLIWEHAEFRDDCWWAPEDVIKYLT